MTTGATEQYSTPPSTIAVQYETLRMAALGEALPPEARNGLLLFLRRGMWAWARTLAPPSARERSTHAPSLNSTVPGERKTVIYVLAAMAANTLDRRTR